MRIVGILQIANRIKPEETDHRAAISIPETTFILAKTPDVVKELVTETYLDTAVP